MHGIRRQILNLSGLLFFGALLGAHGCGPTRQSTAHSRAERVALHGRIVGEDGRPIGGVVVRLSPGAATAITDLDGAFSFFASADWNGEITPTRHCCEFAPAMHRGSAASAPVQSFDFVMTQSRALPGCNRRPVADAGDDQEIEATDDQELYLCTLDGSRSRDDGPISEFKWFCEGAVIADGPRPTVKLAPGNHRITLRITDDVGVTAEDDVNIQIRRPGIGNTFFVSPLPEKGSDLNPGTEERPLQTIARAASLARPGDTIILTAGTYSESDIRFARSGEPDAPITIEGRQGDEVILTAGSSGRWVFDFTGRSPLSRRDAGHYVFRNFQAHGCRHIWRFAFPGKADEPKPHHITIEDVKAWDCASVIAARNSGVAHITIRRCDFSRCNGTEGAIDFSNNVDDLDTPRSGSHDILIEDCAFHDNNANQQINGIVTQGAVSNVTIRRTRCWNNSKYGFALKGSGNFVLDACASWGNGSAQYYLRGMVPTDPRPRKTAAANTHLLTNCIGIGPRNAGSAVVIWRECTSVRLYNCTIVTLRDEKRTKSGGPFGNGERQLPPILPMTADIRNCAIVTFDGGVMWFLQVNNLPHWQNRRFEGDHNLYYKLGGGSTTLFRYQNNKWTDFADWQAHWARGDSGGDDLLNGSTATHADAHSLWADPGFEFVTLDPEKIPMSRTWPADYREIIDPRPRSDSSMVGRGEDLSRFGLAQLKSDFEGSPRMAGTPWTIGALQPRPEASALKVDIRSEESSMSPAGAVPAESGH